MEKKENEFSFVLFVKGLVNCAKVIGKQESARFFSKRIVYPSVKLRLMNSFEGFLEELFKFCVLFFFCTKFIEFNEPMDGIVYGITASLGFAFWENLQYIYMPDREISKSLQVAWSRAFTAVPSHAFDGVIMGFFIGRHYFRDYKTNTNLILALLIPVTLHGFYDWVLMEESINRNFMYLVMVVELGLVVYLYRNLKAQQLVKKKEEEINTRR